MNIKNSAELIESRNANDFEVMGFNSTRNDNNFEKNQNFFISDV